MSVKNRIRKIENRIYTDDKPLVVAEESLDEKGFFLVKDHEALGLLSREDVEARFDNAVIFFIVYVENWRDPDARRSDALDC